MSKTTATLVMGVLAATVLAGCGGEDAYCAAVTENKRALDSFGTKTTQADLETETKAVQSVATTAPDEIKQDWSTVGAAMDRVTKELESADLTIEDLADPDERSQLSEDDLAGIAKAYDAFNKTEKQREAIVLDVLERCEITLK
jgi:hypothetical protein